MELLNKEFWEKRDAAMILRKDNPRFVDYVSEFNNTVNMFMVKPEH